MTDTSIPGLVRATLHGDGMQQFLCSATLSSLLQGQDMVMDIEAVHALEELARSSSDLASEAQQALDECVVILRPTDPDILDAFERGREWRSQP